MRNGAGIGLISGYLTILHLIQTAYLAGYEVLIKDRFMDNSGIDLSIEVPGEIIDFLSPSINAQVKCRSVDAITGSFISCSIDQKTYNRLAHENLRVPQILIVVLVPKDINLWMNHGIKKDRILTMTKISAYWISIKGEKKTQNKSKTVRVPVEQKLTSDTLVDLMYKVARNAL
ncbi:MAG: DUF4365 domain-containing protein [Elainellaceae cyanobacterium]